MRERSTDEADYSKYRLHGRVKFSTPEKGIILSRALGPFNLELLQAFKIVEPIVINEVMASDGKWCEVVVFEESCNGLDKMFAELCTYIKDVKESGDAPLAAVYVFPEDIECAEFMKEKYKKCYEEAGILFSTFNDEEEAIRWAKTYLTP